MRRDGKARKGRRGQKKRERIKKSPPRLLTPLTPSSSFLNPRKKNESDIPVL
jgi:hypothetical protein